MPPRATISAAAVVTEYETEIPVAKAASCFGHAMNRNEHAGKEKRCVGKRYMYNDSLMCRSARNDKRGAQT